MMSKGTRNANLKIRLPWIWQKACDSMQCSLGREAEAQKAEMGRGRIEEEE
jgi:hypothetical protein